MQTCERRRTQRESAACASALVLALVAGCGTLPNGRGWGEDVTPLPGWERIGWAAQRAALDPGTWVPAAAAVGFTIDRFDRRVSDWATKNTPLFSSPDSADSNGSNFLTVLRTLAVGSALVAPSGTDAAMWAWSKVKGLTVEWVGWEASLFPTNELKSAVGRRRPDGSDRRSFPSANATEAFSYATFTAKNADSIEMPDAARLALKIGAYGTAATSAWSRVEAQKHFPSDVLAGAAIGHFFSSFVHDAFLGLPKPGEPTIDVAPAPGGGVTVGLSIDF
jgi:PAP2 superfamily protein